MGSGGSALQKDRKKLDGTEGASGKSSALTNHRRATNPFIVFFLRLCKKKPKKPVTELARIAGKIWTRMSIDQRKKYIDIANEEKKRREERKRKRKCACPR